MKIIFIILLLANMAYVIGNQFFSEIHNRLMPVQENPEKIVLISAHQSCLIWGDFYEEQIQYAQTVLSELFPEMLYSREESGNTIMFWLYIPPFPNKEAANREINKLRNLGIVSFRVKDETQWKNAISLGMFYDRKDALEQLREIEKKGIVNAKIEDRSILLRKIIIHNPTQTIREQIQKIVEQFDDTQLIQGKCERL